MEPIELVNDMLDIPTIIIIYIVMFTLVMLCSRKWN